jgi:hypothetical protein
MDDIAEVSVGQSETLGVEAGLLIAAAIILASGGHTPESAATQARCLEIALRRGPLGVQVAERPF